MYGIPLRAEQYIAGVLIHCHILACLYELKKAHNRCLVTVVTSSPSQCCMGSWECWCHGLWRNSHCRGARLEGNCCEACAARHQLCLDRGNGLVNVCSREGFEEPVV